MPLDGPSGVSPGLRGAEFLQDLTGVRPPTAEKLPGSTKVPGMGAVAVAAQAVPVREGGQPSPVQAARSPATQSGSFFSALFDRMGAALRNLFTRQPVVLPATGPRVQSGQASQGAARSTPTQAAPQRMALQASVRTAAFSDAVGRFQAELGRSPQTHTPAQLLAMAAKIEERFIGAGAREQVGLPQDMADGFQDLVFELQMRGSSRLDATALAPVQAALAQATDHLQAATDPTVQRIQQGLQNRIQEDADNLPLGARLPNSFTGSVGSATAAAAAQFNQLSQPFSQLFIEDLLRNGIEVNGQRIEAPPAGDTAQALATLQSLVKAFGGDADLAGRATSMLAQNIAGAIQQELMGDTAMQAEFMRYMNTPAAQEQAITLAVDRQPDGTFEARYGVNRLKPAANQELQCAVVLGLDVSQPRVAVSVKGFDVQVGDVQDHAAPQRAAGGARTVTAPTGMEQLRQHAEQVKLREQARSLAEDAPGEVTTEPAKEVPGEVVTEHPLSAHAQPASTQAMFAALRSGDPQQMQMFRDTLMAQSPADVAAVLAKGPDQFERIGSIVSARHPDGSRVFSAQDLGRLTAGQFEVEMPGQTPGPGFFRDNGYPSIQLLAAAATSLDGGRIGQLGAEIAQISGRQVGNHPDERDPYALLEPAARECNAVFRQHAQNPAPELQAFLGQVRQGLAQSLEQHHPNRHGLGGSASRSPQALLAAMVNLRAVQPSIVDQTNAATTLQPDARGRWVRSEQDTRMLSLSTQIAGVLQQVVGHGQPFLAAMERQGQQQRIDAYNVVTADGSLGALFSHLVPDEPAAERM